MSLAVKSIVVPCKKFAGVIVWVPDTLALITWRIVPVTTASCKFIVAPDAPVILIILAVISVWPDPMLAPAAIDWTLVEYLLKFTVLLKN